MNRLGFVFLCLVLGAVSPGCDQVRVRPKAATGEKLGEKPQVDAVDLFQVDGQGGLFKKWKWYAYDVSTHLIWSLFDVYAIKSPSGVFLIQIQAYYSGDIRTSGNYRLAVRSAGQEAFEILFDGGACGNPFTNPDFDNCQKDPDRNVWSYIGLSDRRVWRMPEIEARTRKDWDLAFRGTEVILNSGTSGPADVRGALARRFDFFLDSQGQPDAMALRDPHLQRKAREGFQRERVLSEYAYVLPDGVDRAIHESDWFIEDSDGRRHAQEGKAWLVRSRDRQAERNFEVTGIEDREENGQWSSRIRLGFGHGERRMDVEIPVSTSQRLKNECWRLVSSPDGEPGTVDCRENQWDLKFVAAHVLKAGVWRRDWRFFTGGGARRLF